MKIGILCDVLDVAPEMTGHGVYLYNLIKNLNLIDKENEYHLIHCKEMDLDIYKSNKEIIVPLIKPFGGIVWRNVALPLKLKGLDIVHDPIENGFLFNTSFKQVITIHELIAGFPKVQRMRSKLWFKLLYPRILRRADKIISDSESTKRDIMKYLRIPEERIRVIYHAMGGKFKPLEQKEIAEVKQKYDLDFPFILYAGLFIAKKNIPNIIKAYHKLREAGTEYKLVIAGRPAREKYEEIFETVERLNLQKDVVFIGYVPNDELPKLYNAADLFVYPSFYEGFGIAALEAMACGTPVITSNASAFSEAVGDAGIMVNPYDVDELAETMRQVLTNKALRQDMIEKGLERAKMFSWERTARETLRVYEEVYHGN